MSTIDIKEINEKKVCVINSFCIYNLTDICNKCVVHTGNLKYKKLFKTGNSSDNTDVLNRIYDRC